VTGDNSGAGDVFAKVFPAEGVAVDLSFDLFELVIGG
jgi:hypothetical protein